MAILNNYYDRKKRLIIIVINYLGILYFFMADCDGNVDLQVVSHILRFRLFHQ